LSHYKLRGGGYIPSFHPLFNCSTNPQSGSTVHTQFVANSEENHKYFVSFEVLTAVNMIYDDCDTTLPKNNINVINILFMAGRGGETLF
jgi:hypothetical protein